MAGRGGVGEGRGECPIRGFLPACNPAYRADRVERVRITARTGWMTLHERERPRERENKFELRRDQHPAPTELVLARSVTPADCTGWIIRRRMPYPDSQHRSRSAAGMLRQPPRSR